ncbi:MAG: sigma-70 family RNA polymerase sigma factor [Erysipelotrichaceae bacterium]|jgi:RNA polymerase sigma factor (sigma-70 family)|nr:sigma-70 family RNA polymerase sigma factor [Erysipelotrichaceae bacterium]
MKCQGNNDFELLYMIRQGCEIAQQMMIEKYQKLLHKLVNQYLNYNPRLENERDDLYQESLIALFESIDSYREDIDAPFYCLLYRWVRTRLHTCIRDWRKYIAQMDGNLYLSLDTPLKKGSELSLMDITPDPKRGQSLFTLYEQELEDLKQGRFCAFSAQQKEILRLRLEGYTYAEIGARFDMNAKQVDNQLRKIRYKARTSRLDCSNNRVNA